jgi:hypothetical protein
MRTVRVGAGAGYSGDRIEPAVELAAQGALDYLCFECLAERTIALAQSARKSDPESGFDPLLARRMTDVLPVARRNGVRIISNMGAANPRGAARSAARIAAGLGLHGLRFAAVLGDDVEPVIRAGDFALPELGRTTGELGVAIVSANAYLGVEPIVAALQQSADVVLTGRVGDPALFLAPLIHEFGWALDDWTRLGRGTVVGHLLECAGQVTGGYFADPGLKDVLNLARLGFPLAEVDESGDAVMTKVAGSGGRLTVATCKEQLLYEVLDPASYLQPDVTADFTKVRLEDLGPDRVGVRGGDGRARPDQLKVSVGYKAGFVGEGQISYAGSNAVARGRLALEIVRERLDLLGVEIDELDLSLIGVDAVDRSHGSADPREVRARVAARTLTMEAARRIGAEVEALYTNGPSGGGGVQMSAREQIAVASTFIDRDLVRPSVVIEES